MPESETRPAKSPKVQIAQDLGQSWYFAQLTDNDATVTKEQRLEGWKESKRDYTKLAVKVINAMAKRGYSIVPPQQ